MRYKYTMAVGDNGGIEVTGRVSIKGIEVVYLVKKGIFLVK